MPFLKNILNPVCLLAFIFTGCTITKPSINAYIEQGAAYDSLYPYYAEVCAVSQLAPKGEVKGGEHGHAVVYLKGVCRDESAPYPKLKLCEEGTVNLEDPESGTGISVDKMFKSVNWVAVPGKNLFFHGDLKQDDLLNEEHREAVIQKVLKLGLFTHIQFHEEYLKNKPLDMSAEEYVARKTLSTDYALKFGRSVFCASVPVTRPMLGKAVSFLNDLNQEYAEGKAEYHWNGYSDNCAHTVHNALARAGVWKEKSVNQIKFRQFFHLAVPANEFADLAFYTNRDSDLEHPNKIYRNETMKETLFRENWLPVRHGALLRVMGVHLHNELYDKQFTLFILERPLSKNKSRKIQQMISEKRYTDIEMNLRFFEKSYVSTLARICHSEQRNGGDDQEQFKKVYCDYLQAQLEDVRNKLNQYFFLKKRQI